MCLGCVTISSSATLPLGAARVPILLSEVEHEQRPSGNGVTLPHFYAKCPKFEIMSQRVK